LQTWKSFLRNHVEEIASIDLFVVPTIAFRQLFAIFYAWRGRPESLRKTANRALLTEIRRVHMAHRGRYGAPRIHAALRARGIW
jgi:HTH-like domain